jgi:hypothetical protein
MARIYFTSLIGTRDVARGPFFYLWAGRMSSIHQSDQTSNRKSIRDSTYSRSRALVARPEAGRIHQHWRERWRNVALVLSGPRSGKATPLRDCIRTRREPGETGPHCFNRSRKRRFSRDNARVLWSRRTRRGLSGAINTAAPAFARANSGQSRGHDQ